jgi:hypothetical protein
MPTDADFGSGRETPECIAPVGQAMQPESRPVAASSGAAVKLRAQDSVFISP